MFKSIKENKKKFGYFILIFFLSFSSQAEEKKNASNNFCRMFSTSLSKSRFIESLMDLKNRISFLNEGGWPQSITNIVDSGIGLCWWHSRFQRAASYLTIYSPEKVKPNSKDVKKMVRSIAKMDKVVEVPGFNNLNEFTIEHKDIIIKELEAWQLRDTIGAAMRSINPYRPSFHPYDKNLHLTFNRINYLINTEKVLPFVVEQMKGFDTHSYLVIKSEVLGSSFGDKKIVLTLVDSNTNILYRAVVNPDTHDRITLLNTNDSLGLSRNAIYIDYSRDLRKIEKSIQQYCPNYKINITPSLNLSYEI